MSARARALRQAGALTATGLAVELVTLVWAHPTAFLVFAGIGGALVAAGILRYLLALVLPAPPGEEVPGTGATLRS